MVDELESLGVDAIKLMYDDMSPAMRQVLIQALELVNDPRARAEMAVHLISISPEYCVMK